MAQTPSDKIGIIIGMSYPNFSSTDPAVQSHRAHKLASTLAHWHEQFRLHLLPAWCGHHLNPMEGFWRFVKDRVSAGRCFPDLHQFYQRTRQVLMAHHERPIYAFHW
jgi:hypothetical protein